MKYTRLILVLGILWMGFSACTGGSNRAPEVDFVTTSLDEALQKAGKENKKVYLHAYTSWCGYCKKMDRKVYTDSQVASVMNREFVNIRINMEKGEGPMLAARYGVNVYPTLFILNADGSVFQRHEGYLSGIELVKFAGF